MGYEFRTYRYGTPRINCKHEYDQHIAGKDYCIHCDSVRVFIHDKIKIMEEKI